MSLSAHDYVACPSCDGNGYHGDPEYGSGRNCRRCNGRGNLLACELDEDEMDELERAEGDNDD